MHSRLIEIVLQTFYILLWHEIQDVNVIKDRKFTIALPHNWSHKNLPCDLKRRITITWQKSKCVYLSQQRLRKKYGCCIGSFCPHFFIFLFLYLVFPIFLCTKEVIICGGNSLIMWGELIDTLVSDSDCFSVENTP